MKVSIVLNPIAGCGLGVKAGAEVARLLAVRGHAVSVSESRAPGDARAAAAAAQAADVLACVGGDGTVNEVINGIPLSVPQAPCLAKTRNQKPETRNHHAPRLAVLPVGTGNVLAKELHLPRTPREFCAMVEKGTVRRLDLGLLQALRYSPPPACGTAGGIEGASRPMRIGSPPQPSPQAGKELSDAVPRRFVLMAGAGFDAHVVRTFHARRTGTITMGQFFFHAVRELVGFRPPRIAVVADGRLVERSASFVQVANVASFGGPFIFAVGARPDDGWLKLMWFTGRTRLDVLRLFCGGFARVPVLAGGVRFARACEVRLFSGDPVPLQVDGDPAGLELPVQITILHHALSIIVSKASSLT